MAEPKFSGWQDLSLYSANGLRDASQRQSTQYQAPSLSPYTQVEATNVGGVAPITAAGTMRDQRQFMDPYMGDVVNTSLSGYDLDAGRRIAAAQAAGARGGAFGGSRFAIGEAMLGGELARNRGALEAGLRSDGWRYSLDKALGLQGTNQQTELQRVMQQASLANQKAMADAQNANNFAMKQAELQQTAGLTNAQLSEAQKDRQLQALSLIGNTANSVAGNERADLALIADLGAQERQIAQQQALAELQQLQAQGQMMGTIPVGAYTGQTIDSTSSGTTEQSGGVLGSILGGLAGSIGSIIGKK